jgi:hypothetical protein
MWKFKIGLQDVLLTSGEVLQVRDIRVLVPQVDSL